MTDRARSFDALYSADPDPWAFLTSPYERGKYGATLAALGKPRYGAVLEVGCSIGVMTALLAARSDRLTALDVSAVALEHARARCPEGTVDFVEAEVPEGWPEGRFDLILLSEVLYFLGADEVARCARLAAAGLCAGGEILTVNWLGQSDTALSGDAAAELFLAAGVAAGLDAISIAATPFYRIDRLR